MSALVEFFVETDSLSPYPRWVFWVVLLLVVGLTQLIKLPIKHFTNKITNDKLREKVNLVIMIIPFALGFSASGICYACGLGFSATAGTLWGTTSQVIYEFVVKLVQRIKNGFDINSDTIAQDLQDAQDTADEAEEKFNELVEKAKKGE